MAGGCKCANFGEPYAWNGTTHSLFLVAIGMPVLIRDFAPPQLLHTAAATI